MPTTKRIKVYKFSELSNIIQADVIYNKIREKLRPADISAMKGTEYAWLCNTTRQGLEKSTYEFTAEGKQI